MEGERKPAVLISGGSGLIGTYLTKILTASGYTVNHLSRKAGKTGQIKTFSWDPEKGRIDRNALENTGCIIHLAGENLGEKRWSEKRKEEIISSRVGSAKLLYDAARETGAVPPVFITASGISCYGTVTTEKIFSEDDPFAGDFLGTVCRKWEEAAGMFAAEGTRTVMVRTAIVLEKNDTALKRMMMPARFGFLSGAGRGSQYMPWIHVDDACGIYLKAVTDNSMSGPYNAASPMHVTHDGFMRTLASVLNKPLSPVNVPPFVLKAMYGEMAGLVLEGSRVSVEKIKNAGYNFKFENLREALTDVLKRGR